MMRVVVIVLAILAVLELISPAQAASLDKRQQGCSVQAEEHYSNIDSSLEGYNILKGYPLAKAKDPGFQSKIFTADYSNNFHSSDCRYQIPFGMEVTRLSTCLISFRSTVIESSKDLRESLATQVSVSGGGWGVEFSASKDYEEETQSFTSSNSKKVESSATCQFFRIEVNDYEKPKFHRLFIKHIHGLKRRLDSGSLTDRTLFEFLDKFGTHYVTSALYGSRFTHMYKMTSSALEKMRREKIDVEAAASYSGAFSVGASAGSSEEIQKASKEFMKNVQTTTYSRGSPPPADGKATTWASQVADDPLPIDYTLRSIQEVFDPLIFTEISNYLSDDYARRIREAITNRKMAYCQHVKNFVGRVVCSPRSDYVHTIKPYTKTNWGTWGEIEWCPDGTFAQSMRLKVQKPQYNGDHIDNSIVNSVGLKCRSPICTYPSVPEKWIYSMQGKWGTWQPEISCQYGDVIFGGQARSEPKHWGDNVAVTNYKFVCRHMNAANKHLARERILEANFIGYQRGKWDSRTNCTPGTAICGIQTQIEDDLGGFSDNTALNAVKFTCCTTPA